ncbi:hypothetical protein [Paenibacillus chitinolyticus]|uniref:Uncharacterized protein n=1 Tax=Paenibacillus chitinolyticus TaxID=79263 RepID=A0ABT4FL38_9BACL|nr:hypothetical protein [Paenibacillus chitinolyticus]MCY9589475.1 hypothetical protein [Paenibacillus chitinolyticus]MCY9599247.1 hypothetical protein [Paenibacillus chitinolyticus]
MAKIATDVVVIEFVVVAGVRRIQEFRVIGSAKPCQGFLAVGKRVRAAERCLLTHGFKLLASSRDVLVFTRPS